MALFRESVNEWIKRSLYRRVKIIKKTIAYLEN